MQQILLMAVMLGLFYFMLIRPQQKRAKEVQNMHASLEAGNKIITIGGLHATIDEVRETTIVVRTAEGIKMEFEKAAVRSITQPELEEPVQELEQEQE